MMSYPPRASELLRYTPTLNCLGGEVNGPFSTGPGLGGHWLDGGCGTVAGLAKQTSPPTQTGTVIDLVIPPPVPVITFPKLPQLDPVTVRLADPVPPGVSVIVLVLSDAGGPPPEMDRLIVPENPLRLVRVIVVLPVLSLTIVRLAGVARIEKSPVRVNLTTVECD